MDSKRELIAEIKRNNMLSEELTNLKNLSLVSLPDSINLRRTQLAFSSDALILGKRIEANSIGVQAQALVDQFEGEAQNLFLHVFGISESVGVLQSGRCELLFSKIKKDFKKRGIQIERSYTSNTPILKVLIMPDRSLYYSFLTEDERAEYFQLMSPFPGGFTTITDDKDAPSRAFKKIIEAQKVMGKFITSGETLLDLGACPGGWSYIGLVNGASVTSVDRSPVVETLLRHPKLEYFEGDAFKFNGTGFYDWVVSDIICAPERILELIDKWVIPKKCNQFVFTLKFKGDDNYDVMKLFKNHDELNTSWNVILRQLNVNKNEATIMGWSK